MLMTSMLVFACLAALGLCYFTGGFGSLAWLWMLPSLHSQVYNSSMDFLPSFHS